MFKVILPNNVIGATDGQCLCFPAKVRKHVHLKAPENLLVRAKNVLYIIFRCLV